MKNIIIALSCLTLLSCQNKANNNTDTTVDESDTSELIETILNHTIRPTATEKTLFKDSLPYQTIRFYKTTTKSTDPKDSAKYAYVKSNYPQFANDYVFLNNKVLSIATAEPWTGNKTYSMEKASNLFFKEYLEFKKEYPESPATYTWDEDLKVSFQDVNLLVLTDESYVYTGGAHGLESIVYFNLDLENQKELILSDLLVSNYSNKLTDVAESIFRKDEDLNPTEPLVKYFFENDIFKLTENFAITDEGLLFTYNPYEIRAYAEGTTDILIPYAKIKDLINPNSFISKYIKD